jgi:hypothetical protein
VNGVHEPGELSAHALGLLGGAEARAVEQHLAGCAACRREWSELRGTAAILDSVPPEMFFDGPPDNDLLLQRTLRQVRAETGARRRKRRFGIAAAAVVVTAALLGAGALVGEVLTPQTTVVAAPAAGRTVKGAEGPVTMSATITPAKGWVRLAATVRGIPPGERCSLIVVAKDGSEHVAGSWLVGVPGPAPGAPLQGSTIIEPDDVAAVTVRNDAGRSFITVPV